MTWIMAAIVIVASAMFLLARRFEKRKPTEGALPYQKAQALFSAAERSFLGVLQQAVGRNAIIFGKVRVADVVEPKAGLSRSARQKAFNKISAKHFDFLLCNKENLSVICAIELNDGSHQSKRRQERDEFLKEVCGAADVPLIQPPAKTGYVIDEVKQLIAPYLGDNDTPYKERLQAPAPKKSNGSGKICQNCSAPMVKRMAKKGSFAGMEFWACSAYPQCKTIEAISA
jgi:hypothetical protein